MQLIFACLLVPRLLSALLNIIHDCDEVFNYWEPLHFLLYGHGMQTWEYRRAPPSQSASSPSARVDCAPHHKGSCMPHSARED